MKNEMLRITTSLPGCPVGRYFKKDINGNWFHSIKDEELLKDKTLIAYRFTKEEVAANPDYFEPVKNNDKERLNVYSLAWKKKKYQFGVGFMIIAARTKREALKIARAETKLNWIFINQEPLSYTGTGDYKVIFKYIRIE